MIGMIALAACRPSSAAYDMPRARWTRPGLPGARAAMYSMLKGEREVLFQTEGILASHDSRHQVYSRIRSRCRNLGLQVSIHWAGCIEDENGSRTVWLMTRKQPC